MKDVKERLLNRTMNYKVREDLDDLIMLYEQRIHSLKTQVEVLTKELVSKKVVVGEVLDVYTPDFVVEGEE